MLRQRPPGLWRRGLFLCGIWWFKQVSGMYVGRREYAGSERAPIPVVIVSAKQPVDGMEAKKEDPGANNRGDITEVKLPVQGSPGSHFKNLER